MPRVALPHSRFRKPRQFFRSAVGASNLAVRPTQLDHELTAVLEVREPDDRVSESVWRFHESSMQPILRNVKYVSALQ